MADERKELIARLRAVKNDWETTPCYNGTRLEAAALLERDGARITELEAERDEARKENDWLRAYTGQSAKACVYCGLGADVQGQCERGFPGCARGDDQMLCPEVGVAIERDEARAAFAKAQRDAERINWLESRAYRVDVRVKKSGNRLWVVNPPACTEYELSKSLREAIDAAIAKERSHASE